MQDINSWIPIQNYISDEPSKEELEDRYNFRGDLEKQKLANYLSTIGSADEIYEKMHRIALEELDRNPNIRTKRFAEARLKYLVDEKYILFSDLFWSDQLMSHLQHIEEECWDFIEVQRPRMRDSWHIQEEMKKDFLKGMGLIENMEHQLYRMALDEYVFN